MIPKMWDCLGTELVIVWADGHESYYPLETLRRNCPCAACSGEPDLFGRVSKGPEPRYTDDSFRVRSIEPSGNYGIQISWADDHVWGIWTWERLRGSCPCEACVGDRDRGEKF